MIHDVTEYKLYVEFGKGSFVSKLLLVATEYPNRSYANFVWASEIGGRLSRYVVVLPDFQNFSTKIFFPRNSTRPN